MLDDYQVRKAARVAAWNVQMASRGTGRKIACTACSGSRYYDAVTSSGASLRCGACNGTGRQWEPLPVAPPTPETAVDLSTLTRSQRKRAKNLMS